MSETKHNGKLGKHEVSFWPESSPGFVCIEESDGWKDDEPDFVQLTAEQALSLLAWLEENKPVLEKLVQENSQPTA